MKAKTAENMTRVILTTFILAIIMATHGTTSHAEERAAAEGMLIKADRMTHESTEDLLTATGNVQMTWQDLTMTSERATYNRKTRVMTASGNVYMVKGDDIMLGEQLVMDTDTGRAEMENGRLYMAKGNFRGEGRQIARMGDDDYAFRQGSLTTCDDQTPSWKFGASDLDISVEDYATGTNVIFYVKDIPVFYFPYIMLPVKKERQTGFMFPSFGRSSKRGEFVDIPFYWAISPSQEATFDLDIQSKRGIGLGADYRYLRNKKSEGSIGGYLIHDNVEKKIRGQFLQFHKEEMPDNLSLITSINMTSDRTFLTDYTEKSGLYNRQYYDSRVVLTKFWENWLASAQGIYTQDFYAGTNTTTLQRAPELSVYGVREQLPYTPVYFDIDSIMTNYYREKGMQGQRIILSPRLTGTDSFFDGRLNAQIFGGAQLRGYNLTEGDPGIKEKSAVAVPEFGADIGSSFSSIYKTDILGMSGLRHELVPSISYRYTFDRDQNSYPLFDQSDRTVHQNAAYLSIASHLGGKLEKGDGKPAEYRYLQTVRLKQGYSFSGSRPSLLTLVQDNSRWTNLSLESETWVTRYLRLLADIGFNHYTKHLATSALGLEVNDSKGNSGGISYRRSEGQVEYLEGNIIMALLKPVYFSYSNRYSFNKQDSLSSDLSVEYRHQCWSIIGTYTQRPDNRSWTINLNLTGLFSIGSNAMGGGR